MANRLTTVHKTQHRKLKTKHNETHQKYGLSQWLNNISVNRYLIVISM